MVLVLLYYILYGISITVLYIVWYEYYCIIESVDSISRDELDVQLTQYITNA